MAIWTSVKTLAFVILGTAALGACMSPGGGSVVSSSAARGASEVEIGTVIDAQQVTIQEKNNGVGAVVGALAGAAVGSQIGGGSKAHVVGGVGGAVVGGLAGNEIEKAADRAPGIQYTVRLQSGRTVVVTQGRDPMIPVGARVQVIYDSNGEVRVLPAR